jgi:predicted regulator of Ras-like GTPase activity (Roadblock/LC7/MglB family)
VTDHSTAEATLSSSILAGKTDVANRQTLGPMVPIQLFQASAEVARRQGVTACFVCHDGLLLETAGRAPDFDALSAMAQKWMTAGKEAALTLSLGKVRQMVIVGHEHKLALFVIGPLALGIWSPSTVSLGRTLAN